MKNSIGDHKTYLGAIAPEVDEKGSVGFSPTTSTTRPWGN
jgi:hypothetical protein